MDESLYREVIQSVKVIGDLAARLDERVKINSEKMQQILTKIDVQVQEDAELAGRISVLEKIGDSTTLEKSIEKLERETEDLEDDIEIIRKELGDASRWRVTSESRWKMFVEFLYKVAYAIIAAYLLYKLNFPTSNGP